MNTKLCLIACAVCLCVSLLNTSISLSKCGFFDKPTAKCEKFRSNWAWRAWLWLGGFGVLGLCVWAVVSEDEGGPATRPRTSRPDPLY